LAAVNLSGEKVTASLNLAKVGITQANVTERILGLPLADVASTNVAACSLTLPAYEGHWLLVT
jgi:hypothetical protein